MNSRRQVQRPSGDRRTRTAPDHFSDATNVATDAIHRLHCTSRKPVGPPSNCGAPWRACKTLVGRWWWLGFTTWTGCRPPRVMRTRTGAKMSSSGSEGTRYICGVATLMPWLASPSAHSWSGARVSVTETRICSGFRSSAPTASLGSGQVIFGPSVSAVESHYYYEHDHLSDYGMRDNICK